MGAEYIEKSILCPYFHGLGKLKIHCEALNYDGKMFTQTFETHNSRNAYIENFCGCYCWQGCPVAKIIEEKYQE